MRPLSARNPRVQRLARLARDREERTRERALLVEGPGLIGAALDASASILEVFVDADAAERPSVVAILERLPAGLEPWVLPPGVLQRVGDAVTSQGIAAIVRQGDAPLPTPDGSEFVLVLVEVSDPGNVGTLIRAAVAAGAGAVVVVNGADATAPKVVRSSAGALFAIDVVSASSAEVALAHLSALGYRLIATVVDGGTPYDELDLSGPLAVVLGNEAHGLSAELADGLERATIPMAGGIESLNVAMAGTVMAFEALRQRRDQANGLGMARRTRAAGS